MSITNDKCTESLLPTSFVLQKTAVPASFAGCCALRSRWPRARHSNSPRLQSTFRRDKAGISSCPRAVMRSRAKSFAILRRQALDGLKSTRRAPKLASTLRPVARLNQLLIGSGPVVCHDSPQCVVPWTNRHWLVRTLRTGQLTARQSLGYASL